MRTPPALVCALAVLAAGCGGDDEKPVPAPPETAREVRAVFADYTEAMRSRDYAAACRHLAPESVAKLKADLENAGVAPAGSCSEALARLYGLANASDRRQLDQVARTVRVEGVFLGDREDAVYITWAARVDGRRVPVQQPVRRIGGEWKLVGAG